MSNVLGTCSVCGGRVVLPASWMSVLPPVPTCEKCGATMKGHGPVIEMEPRLPPNVFRIGETYVTDESGNLVRKE